MPMVLLNRDAEVLPDNVTFNMGLALTRAVAEALHVEEDPDAHLTEDDIEVIVRDVRHDLDVGNVTLAITVFANDYPARKANLDERREKIEEAVRAFIASEFFVKECLLKFQKELKRDKKAFVWVLLAPGSFGFV